MDVKTKGNTNYTIQGERKGQKNDLLVERPSTVNLLESTIVLKIMIK
jgi:hypothetical protein